MKVKVKVKSLSCVDFLRPHGLYVAYQSPPSMGFPRQAYWSGLPFPSPEDLPNPRTEPGSPALQADSLLFEPQGRSVIENTAVLWVMNFIQDERREGRKLFQAGQCVNEYDH